MTNEKLREAMSLIEDEYIAESMTEYEPRMPRWVKRSLATAAMLVVTVGIALLTYAGIGKGLMKEDGSNIAGDTSGIGSSSKPDISYGGVQGDEAAEDDASKDGATVNWSIVLGESVGTDTRVSARSYEGGVLTFDLTGYSEGSVGVLILHDSDGTASYSAYGLEVDGADFDWLRKGYENRSELIGATLDVEDGIGTLSVDLGELDESFSVYLYVEGERYRLYLE